MSSSFRNGTLLALAVLPASLLSPAHAAQKYFVPSAELGAEWYSNRELASMAQSTTAYIAKLDGRMGLQGQLGHTEIRPRFNIQEFPDRGGIDPVEAFLDIHSDWHSLRASYAFIGNFARQDTFNAEYGQARFDDGDPSTPPDPNDPQNDDNGIVLVGTTRTTYRLEPSFQYEISERNAFGARLRYTDVHYSSADFEAREQRVGYESPYAEATFIRALGERTHLSVGPYYTVYDADNGFVKTDTTGVLVGFNQVYERSDLNVQFTAEHSDITNDTVTDPALRETTDSAWGIEIGGYRRNVVGGVRYSIGRFLEPSSLGNRRQRDEARLQYDRPMSPRFSWSTALRLSEDTRIGENATTRKRAQAELRLRGLFTRTTYWSIGYRYAWQDVGALSGSQSPKAHNNTVFLSFGYRALDPRPRDLR